MLGRFLELTVRAPRILDSWHFWQRLGFTPATVGEAWPQGYAVLTDGRIAIGLHASADVPHPALTWVLPGLAGRVEALEATGVEFEHRVLGDDAFHEATFADPDRQLVRLVEARTFSPPDRAPPSKLGWFEEYAMPVADLARTQEFWERFGFVTAAEGERPWPHLALTSDTLDLGLYRTRELQAPTLRFIVDDVQALREDLAGAGIEAESRLPRSLDPENHLLVVTPDGTNLLAGPEGEG
jgi:catechol 2,3-dioxygenase-like lactoylglutathione lyase family enzyme